MSIIKDFKEFAIKGNAVDMAVGIIIGAAFGGVVQSLVKDIISPIIGLIGKADFSNWFLVIKNPDHWAIPSKFVEAQKLKDVVLLSYGEFITTLINFIIIAFAIFLVVKAVNKLRKQTPPAPAAPPAQEVLLTEIRDLLKTK